MLNNAGAAAQQVACGPHLFGVDVGHREISSAHEHRNLEGIDAIILGFATVDSLHIERMSQDEVDAVFFTQIRDPVPAVHAFNANHKVISKGVEQCQ